ncbi:MAG: 30S ribosomal protein S8 [Kiritimatiellae bacterium]|nr:30S ribosomal protein S8 [Kiritimatiellia bacterium]
MTIDPISDMLTTIRNGLKARLHSVATPASNLKGEIARVMKEAGYIADAVTTTEFPKKLVITLKYSDRAVPAITEIKRVSKPGLRHYAPVGKIPAVLDGMGLVILSTSKGVMSGAQAKKERLGGEVICTVA